MEQRGGGDYLTEQRGGGGAIWQREKKKRKLELLNLANGKGRGLWLSGPMAAREGAASLRVAMFWALEAYMFQRQWSDTFILHQTVPPTYVGKLWAEELSPE